MKLLWVFKTFNHLESHHCCLHPCLVELCYFVVMLVWGTNVLTTINQDQWVQYSFSAGIDSRTRVSVLVSNITLCALLKRLSLVTYDLRAKAS